MTTRVFQERLLRRARRAGLVVTPALAAELERYFRLLSKWNEKMNLTAFPLREPGEEALDRLLVEPLAAARHLPQRDEAGLAVIDIGSGSGSPAIPMRLAAGPLRLTLVEAKTRKAVFLLEAARHLGLAGSTVVETARFEQLLTRPELHEAFDVLTIRAVRVEVRALLTLQAFLKPDGRLLWFRGPTGPDAPGEEVFPLRWTATYPLVESLRSRLVVLTKDTAGGRR